MVYDEVARDHPSHVAAIAIRQLSPAEQVLSHGTPESLDPRDPLRNASAEHGVPTVAGRDGRYLLRALPGLFAATRDDSDS